MKRKIVTLLLMTMICVGGTACGSKAEGTAETASEVATVEEDEVAADTTEEVAAETTEEATTVDITEDTETESADADTAEGTDEESKYVVFTDASNEEVEAFAKQVVDAVLAKDWETVGDMIEYPIGTEEEGNLCNNKEEFVAYANSTGFSEEAMTSLAAWDVADLWANWQGACIDNGNIWFRDVDTENKVMKIVSLFDLREAGGEITE